MILQFDVEAPGSENIPVPRQGADGILFAAIVKRARNLRRQAPAGANQPFGVRGQEGAVDARFVVETFQLGGGGDLQQVVVPRVGFGEEKEVRRLAVSPRIAVFHPARREVGLDPDHRPDSGRLGGVMEFDRAEQGAVVGDGEGGHAEFLRARDQTVDLSHPI